MSAKDYRICPALFNAYIAKVSKCNPNLMTDDRRAITEIEIMALIDWYLDKELGEEHNVLSYVSDIRKGKRVQLKFVDDKTKDGQL